MKGSRTTMGTRLGHGLRRVASLSDRLRSLVRAFRSGGLVRIEPLDEACRLFIRVWSGKYAGVAVIVRGRRSRQSYTIECVESSRRVWAGVLEPSVTGLFVNEPLDFFVERTNPGTRSSRTALVSFTKRLPFWKSVAGRFVWDTTVTRKLVLRPATDAEAIQHGGIFEEELYLGNFVSEDMPENPVQHYITEGAKAGLRASALVDDDYYKRTHPWTRAHAPIAHYARSGWLLLCNP